jgi:hypothetical protein
MERGIRLCFSERDKPFGLRDHGLRIKIRNPLMLIETR